MPRRRRIKACIVICSLLLSIATAALWARSLTTADQLIYANPTSIAGHYARNEWSVFSAYGFLALGTEQRVPADDASADWLQKLDRETGLGWSFGVVDGYPLDWEGFILGFHRIGFSSGTDLVAKVPRNWKSVEIPDWLLLLVVSIPTQVFLVRMIRARVARKRRGFPLDVANDGVTRMTEQD